VPLPNVDDVAGSRIGRYFDVVTLVPTSLLVTYTFTLFSTRPWDGTPDWSLAARTLSDVGLGGAALLAAVSLALSFALHPLQFGMVQALEGYWGSHHLTRQIMVARTLHHRRMRSRLRRLGRAARAELLALDADADNPGPEAVRAVIEEREATRLQRRYPADLANIMPTRLGNMLRRYEQESGAQYGLPILGVAPHLSLVAPPEHAAYIADQRTELDRAVRLCWLSGIAAVVTVVFLWRANWWLLLAAVPYGAAYLFYRGAVIVAAEYGTAVATVLDLNRFTLYERLGLSRPRNSGAEYARNLKLRQLLRGVPVHLPYQQAQPPQSPDDGASG
jgi:hypothetical protein